MQFVSKTYQSFSKNACLVHWSPLLMTEPTSLMLTCHSYSLFSVTLFFFVPVGVGVLCDGGWGGGQGGCRHKLTHILEEKIQRPGRKSNPHPPTLVISSPGQERAPRPDPLSHRPPHDDDDDDEFILIPVFA